MSQPEPRPREAVRVSAALPPSLIHAQASLPEAER